MNTRLHRTREQLDAGLPVISESPKDQGPIEMIVCRPAVDERRIIEHAELDVRDGLVGDSWRDRGSSQTADGLAHPDMQLNIMNSRVVDLVATSKDRWPLAGDQIYVDLDLSKNNLPPGCRLQLGTAIVEVTAMPHAGCKKFVARFGRDAMLFVNSGLGKELCLRGINARVVQPGAFSVGDLACKLGGDAV